MRRRPALAAVALVVAALVSGCARDDTTSNPLHPRWQPAILPMPPGPAGRIVLRDAATCDGTWYVVGAVVGTDDASRPAAWTSADAHAWSSLAIDAHEVYAREAYLRSVACRDGRMVAVGSRSGGAHGNPRTSSWYQRPDGTLVDMRAVWTLYGGADAVSVNRVAAGPDDWLISGSRRSGAAVWVSADATDFHIVDHDPALSSDARTTTAALDQAHDGAQWTVVGRAELDGKVSPVPMAWTSQDGEHWTRQSVPAGTDGFADLERVVDVGDDLVAAGVRDRSFGLWRRHDDRWRAEKSFGALAAEGQQPAFVSSLAVNGPALLAAVSDGVRFRLWARHGDDWQEVSAPAALVSSGDTTLTVANDDSTVLLVEDDGTSGRVWLTTWAAVGR